MSVYVHRVTSVYEYEYLCVRAGNHVLLQVWGSLSAIRPSKPGPERGHFTHVYSIPAQMIIVY